MAHWFCGGKKCQKNRLFLVTPRTDLEIVTRVVAKSHRNALTAILRIRCHELKRLNVLVVSLHKCVPVVFVREYALKLLFRVVHAVELPALASKKRDMKHVMERSDINSLQRICLPGQSVHSNATVADFDWVDPAHEREHDEFEVFAVIE
jgi:hypothetical protein